MPATARKLEIDQSDFDSTGGGAYAELEVPADYEATLSDVEDYDYTDRGKSRGWIFHYGVETPSGSTATFKTWLSFNKNARWKLIEVLEAHGFPIEEGINSVDPNQFIGEVVGVHLDFGTEKDENGNEVPSAFREIKSIFNLVDEPELPLEEPEIL